MCKAVIDKDCCNYKNDINATPPVLRAELSRITFMAHL